MAWNGNGNMNGFSKRGLGYNQILRDGNTKAWYDSQDLTTITKDGLDAVSLWKDKLLSGRDLIQATGANQPKWFLNDGILFDGIDDFIKTLPFTFNQPISFYMVMKQVTWVLNRYLMDGNTADSCILWQQTTTPGLKAYAGIASSQNNNLPLNTFAIVHVEFNGVNSNFQINKTAKISENFGANNMGGITLGSRGNGTQLVSVQYKEAIFRDKIDLTKEKTIIYNYLSNKYGI